MIELTRRSIYVVCFILIITTLDSSCSVKRRIPSEGIIDPRFVGEWEGNERIVFLKIDREWLQTREKDGTFDLIVTESYNNIPTETRHKGVWWVKEGKFYEKRLSDKSEKPDVYKFDILTENKILFTEISLDETTQTYYDNYSFIDESVE